MLTGIPKLLLSLTAFSTLGDKRCLLSSSVPSTSEAMSLMSGPLLALVITTVPRILDCTLQGACMVYIHGHGNATHVMPSIIYITWSACQTMLREAAHL